MPTPSASPHGSIPEPESSSPPLEFDELLANLQDSHALYYKMMNLEVWALVETLDQVFPGFWGRFMENRHQAMKQFLQRMKTHPETVKNGDFSPFSPPQPEPKGEDTPEPPPESQAEVFSDSMSSQSVAETPKDLPLSSNL